MGSLQPIYRASPTKRARNRRSIYSFQQRSLIDPVIEVFNGPSLDMSCERRDATTVPTQAFSLFNSELSLDLALAFGARLQTETSDVTKQIERAFQLALGRPPSNEEKELVGQHLSEMTRYYKQNPPPARQERPPAELSITSELTGENVRFKAAPPPWKYENNLSANEVSAETRALADVALVLFNSNEFAYMH